jgi:hypothetical protein
VFTSPLVVSDLNNDGYLDIAVGGTNPYGLSVLVGNGDGSFEVQTIFSIRNHTFQTSLTVGNLDADRFPDIFAIEGLFAYGSLHILLNTF